MQYCNLKIQFWNVDKPNLGYHIITMTMYRILGIIRGSFANYFLLHSSQENIRDSQYKDDLEVALSCVVRAIFRAGA